MVTTCLCHKYDRCRAVAVAFTLAFKMLAENDCVELGMNRNLAAILRIPIAQFNLMEVKLLEALIFDASISVDTLVAKHDAIENMFNAANHH